MKHRVLLGTMVLLLGVAGLANADFFNRAPDVLPNTTAAMRNASFWVARMDNPDEVVLSPEQIQAMNDAYQAKIRRPNPFAGVHPVRNPNVSHWWPGYEMIIPDISTWAPRALADTVRAKIQLEIDYVEANNFGNIHGILYSDREKERFIGMMNLTGVPRQITPVHGLTVCPTRLRNVPSFVPLEVGTWEDSIVRFDMFNVSFVGIGTSVSILHTSSNGEYVFVLCREGYGWMQSGNVALGTDEEIDDFVNAEDFIMCCGDRVPFYSDDTCTYASGWFGMGDRLPRANDNNPRHVKIPVRLTSGRLVFESAFIAPDAPVNEGLLPYTRRNVVETIFRQLDNPFDWTGGHFGRNAETPYRDAFRCFGFELPFHGQLFTHFGSNEKVALPPETDEKNVREVNAGYGAPRAENADEQFAIVNSNEAFLTIHILDNGHCQLYLGEINGEPYVFDCHGYGYQGEDGTEFEVKRTVIANMVSNVPAYALGKPMRYLELK